MRVGCAACASDMGERPGHDLALRPEITSDLATIAQLPAESGARAVIDLVTLGRRRRVQDLMRIPQIALSSRPRV